MREIIFYKPYLKELARKNRNNPTKAEKELWKRLKGKQLKGIDFDRQRPINNFIVDFYCHDLKLAIELDGSSHLGKEEADKERQSIIEGFGVTFLRFTNQDVYYNLEGVLEVIANWIEVKNVPKQNKSQ